VTVTWKDSTGDIGGPVLDNSIYKVENDDSVNEVTTSTLTIKKATKASETYTCTIAVIVNNGANNIEESMTVKKLG